jgi:hypothetical protein
MAEIYVPLLDEGTPVWRPVVASHEGGDCYRILSTNDSPDDERWEFRTGEVVRCTLRTLSDGPPCLVAFAKA